MTQPFDMKEWDPDRLAIVFAGFKISRGPGASGYADGEFANIKQNNPSFDSVEGTDGTVTRSKTNRRLTTFTLRTMQSNSATNGFLSAMLLSDEQGQNGAGVGTLEITDMNGTTVFSALRAWVTSPADQSFDRTAKEREWVFHCVRDATVVGGN